MLRRVPGAALHYVVQGLLAVIGAQTGGWGIVTVAAPPGFESLCHRRAVGADVVPPGDICWRRRVVYRGQVLCAVLHRLHERVGHLINVVREVADAAVAPRRGALFQALRRNLHHVPLRRREHRLPFAVQRFRRQPLEVDLAADELRHVGELLREHVLPAARHHRHRAHAELAELVHRFGPRRDVDRLVLDAEVAQELLHLDAARAAGPPVNAQFIHEATFTPLTPCFSIVRATSPERFTSSANSRRYCAAAGRPLGAPIACCTPVIWPSRMREPGMRACSSTSFGFSPPSASSFCAMNASYDAGMPLVRTSWAFLNVRVRYRS